MAKKRLSRYYRTLKLEVPVAYGLRLETESIILAVDRLERELGDNDTHHVQK